MHFMDEGLEYNPVENRTYYKKAGPRGERGRECGRETRELVRISFCCLHPGVCVPCFAVVEEPSCFGCRCGCRCRWLLVMPLTVVVACLPLPFTAAADLSC